MSSSSFLKLRGAAENNLKGFNLSLPHDQLIGITGISGSGKSSLAFDTIYSEGGRRYIETFSPYTRQFLDRLHQPKLESIEGVRPALALEQRNRVTSSRSTVGTITEINEYLKLVWSHLSVVVCPSCKTAVQEDAPAKVTDVILGHRGKVDRAVLLFPVTCHGTATQESIIATLQSQGFLRYLSTNSGEILSLEHLTASDVQQSRFFVVLDRISLLSSSENLRKRLITGIRECYRYGHGICRSLLYDNTAVISDTLLFETPQCRSCGERVPRPRPSLFSFNSPLGACDTCHGFGLVLTVDQDLCVPDQRRSIDEGALVCWSSPSTKRELRALRAFCKEQGIDANSPWQKLAMKDQNLIFNATKKAHGFLGIRAWFLKLQRKSYKMHVRVFLSRFRKQVTCDSCQGSRLKAQALNYQVGKRSLPEIWNTPILTLRDWFAPMLVQVAGDERVEVPLEEIVSRLTYLVDIGLGYLTLGRQSRTLSGGESQRVNLTSVLGARLVNTVIVLDEPSVGLHSSDTKRLNNILASLRDRGNTVLVVEHDPGIIAACDHIVDLGPLAGSAGGEVIYQGTPSDIATCSRSLTAKHLSRSGPRIIATPRSLKKVDNTLIVEDAQAFNLKHVTVTIPLNQLVVLAGVSGSGKSSFIDHCLYQPFQKLRLGMSSKKLSSVAPIKGMRGIDKIEDIILIDQSPVGRTPRSNPATYTKAWDIVRDVLSSSPQAEQLGLSRSSFSFNTDGGRCPVCKGAGALRVEMQFLADVFVECEACQGSRFKEQVLGVTWNRKNVLDFLKMTLDDALAFFSEHGESAKVRILIQRLQPLVNLGLGYLALGQPLSELSGGEAQRVKLASYLADTVAKKSLFILDEPTTGLHPHDTVQLLSALRALISHGHSVLCVEHNFDVIEASDYLIEFGPGGGEAGGELVCAGPLAELLSDSTLTGKSPTLSALCSSTQQDKPRAVPPKSALSARQARDISIIGAREHNLKDVSITIPSNKLTVVTGVSGSGKSSLAFDILFSEGQRRYIDCLSPYARQFITQLKRPDIDRIENVPPTVAVSQKTAPPLGISTLATTTELYQFFRLLYTKVGEQRCPKHGLPISRMSSEDVGLELISRFAGERLFVFSPVVSGRKGNYTELFNRALTAEISEAKIDDEFVSLHPNLRLARHKLHWISLQVAALSATEKNIPLLLQALEQALTLAGGSVEIAVGKRTAPLVTYSTERVCQSCKLGFRELDPQDFSFRSKRGACKTCSGYGKVEGKNKSAQQLVCPDCNGQRIGIIGRNVFLGGLTIHELCRQTAPEAANFLEVLTFSDRLLPVVKPILQELLSRLRLIARIGLDYLSLDRESSTLSGGEAQRLRLARTLGSPLTGVCYVLDEPTIGLHPTDHSQLMTSLAAIRDGGNTVVIVEHDEETIRQADHIIDVGPQGGASGGHIVYSGKPQGLLSCADSLTGIALRGRTSYRSLLSAVRKPESSQRVLLKLRNASANNLQNISVDFPVGRFIVVAGVSGSGKSSLVRQTLLPLLELCLGQKQIGKKVSFRNAELESGAMIERVLEVNQSPVGRTPSSTPASYLGVFDHIRKLYAMTTEAQAQGWSASHFSFNTKGGRCDPCSGRGTVRVPMSFLPDAFIVCESCNGMRYAEETLSAEFQGVSIGDLLKRTIAEARSLFLNHPKVFRSLDLVCNLGLGYLSLGQPTHTLSGGEAQRLKIARELGSKQALDTVYILDEPTTGLHMSDVDKLIRVLQQLVTAGNTVIVIEHNLDVICSAEHLIELGPGPSDKGGRIVHQGPPALLMQSTADTPTKRALLANYGEPSLRKRRAVSVPDIDRGALV